VNNQTQPNPSKKAPFMRRVVNFAFLVLVVFLLGFIPMGLKFRTSSNDLIAAEQQLSLAKIQNSLSSAVIDARRGDYEPARLSASSFFGSLRAETDKASDSAFSPVQNQAVRPLSLGQDDIITLLARNDPASADRLSDLYVSYRKIMNP
jgi:hypothetical protein